MMRTLTYCPAQPLDMEIPENMPLTTTIFFRRRTSFRTFWPHLKGKAVPEGVNSWKLSVDQSSWGWATSRSPAWYTSMSVPRIVEPVEHPKHTVLDFQSSKVYGLLLGTKLDDEENWINYLIINCTSPIILFIFSHAVDISSSQLRIHITFTLIAFRKYWYLDQLNHVSADEGKIQAFIIFYSPIKAVYPGRVSINLHTTYEELLFNVRDEELLE